MPVERGGNGDGLAPDLQLRKLLAILINKASRPSFLPSTTI